jgi:hypothetical protein
VSVDFRCAAVAALCTVSVWAAAPAYAQQQRGAPGAPAQGGAPAGAQARDDAAREAADRLRGAGGTEQSLLGAPAPLNDPYRSAYESTEQQHTDLMNAERVPSGALNQDVYGGQQQPGARGNARVRMGLDAPGGNAPGGNALDAGNGGNGNGPARTPEDAAQSIYHGTGGGKPVGKAAPPQVYRMPW